jgi:hypothetical protein
MSTKIAPCGRPISGGERSKPGDEERGKKPLSVPTLADLGVRWGGGDRWDARLGVRMPQPTAATQ